ncbi:hypothetical protein ACFXG4_27125 [Nocardia sp. NPDC059246]|uniref:hypothetical protein n=1 Tax=unclassified Nocardia TaxID=2637762 RepID=UPI0036BA8F8D
MTTYDGGDAKIAIHPNFDKFVEELRADLDAVDATLNVTIEPRTAEADEKIKRWREEQSRNLEVGVEAKTDEADAELATWRAEQEARPLRIPVGTDTASAKTASSKLKKELSSLKGDLKEAAEINMKITGVAGAASAVSELLAIADAAGQAMHALDLLPAAGLGALAGVAAIKVGTHGISGAFQAYTAANADPVDTAIKQRDALNAVAEAQYQVGESLRSGQTAQREELLDQRDLNDAYRDASRSLRDVNLTLEEQKLNVTDASVAVREAAKNMQRVQFDPTADADQRTRAVDDYQRTVIRLQEAQNKQNDLQQDTARANQLGVEGARNVVAAKQKVVDGVHAEADAAHQLQQAYIAVQKAQDQIGEVNGQNKIASALSKLSPDAREVVEEIHALGPAWKDARFAAQDALTGNGLGGDITHLADVQLPNLKNGLVGINSAINSGLKGTIQELSSATNRADFATFLGNTTKGFQGLGDAAAPVTAAITKIVTVGSEEFPRFGAAIDSAATKFDALVQRDAANGSLGQRFDTAVTSAKELAETVGHIGSAFGSVVHAAGDAGASIDAATGHLSTFLKGSHAQAEMSTFFTRMRQDGENFEPILKDLPGLINGVVQGVQTWSAITMPFLHAAADLLSEHPYLVEAAVIAYAGFKTVKPVVDGASLAIDALASRAGDAAKDASGIGKLKLAGGQLLGLLGNPWTIGLVAAGAAVLTFMDSADKSTEALTRFKEQSLAAIDADRNLQKALQSSGGTLDTGVLDAETQSVKGLRDALAANANDIPGLTDKAAAGFAAAFGKSFGVGQGIADNFSVRNDIDNQSAAMRDAFDKLGLANDQLAQKITGDKGAFDAVTDKLGTMGKGGRDAADKLSLLRDEWALDVSASQPVSDAIKALGDTNKDTANSIDAATNAMERQRQGGLTLENAQLRVNQALTAMNDDAQNASGAVIDASGAIDKTSKSGQLLFQLINQQLIPAWEQVTNAAYRDAIQQGDTSQQATQAAQQTSDAIKQSALRSIESMGLSETQADQLLDHYRKLDGKHTATAVLDTSQADTALEKYQARLDNIYKTEGKVPFWLQLQAQSIPGVQVPTAPGQTNPYAPPAATPGSTPSGYVPWLESQLSGGAHAGGGLLSGPGTDTSDSMYIRASNYEFVTRAAMVRKYGVGIFEALNAGRIDPALIAALPAFAEGGLVGDGTGAATGTGVGTNTGAGNSSHVAELEQYAASLAGQAYGGELDCSGLISKLALKAVGMPTDSGRMSTANEGTWLGALGWQLGFGPSGTFQVGWINDSSMAAGGHTAGTLPDGTNVESSGSAGKVLVGAGALGSGASLFNQHAYLNMASATVNTPDGGIGSPSPGTLATTTNATTQTVVNPQAPLPTTQMTDDQITIETDKAAVDTANSQRNAVYANPNSTAQDKRASDLAYFKAQNALQSAETKGNQSLLSVQGIATKAAGILASGLLSGLGLQDSILSDSNPWNKALNETYDGLKTHGIGGFGYNYTPQNLPTVVTTTTQQPGTDTGGTTTQATTAVGGQNPNAPAVHAYDATQGAEQWRGTVQQILTATNRNTADTDRTVSQIGIESSGNPNAENDTPEGIAAGRPIGLLQVIRTTFDAYKDPRYPGDQTTPTANIAAAFDYVDSRYGGPSNIWPTKAGYRDGGWISGDGGPRTDSIALWGSNGEFMVTAEAAANNAPWLEAANAGSTFRPVDLPGNFTPSYGSGGSGASYDHSINTGDIYALNAHHFTRQLDNFAAQQAMNFLVTQ